MKKNVRKRGFTILELLATIVILGILATLAVALVKNIDTSVKKKEYENLKSTIKVAAEKYMSDTGLKAVYVQTLIDEGLLSTDDETHIIYSPVDNANMNCYTVTRDDKDAYNVEETTECDYEILAIANFELVYCEGTECTPDTRLPDSTWINSRAVRLGVREAAIYDDNGNMKLPLTFDWTKVTKYKWISPLAPDEIVDTAVYPVEIPSSNYIDQEYQVTITYTNEDGTTRDMEVSDLVRIDVNPPYIKSIGSGSEDWAYEKMIAFNIADDESGLNSYIFSSQPNACEPTSGDWIEIKGNAKNKYVEHRIEESVGENGRDFYLCVKDNANNIFKSEAIHISKIDHTVPKTPTITASDGKASGSWHTVANFTLNIGGSEGSSSSSISYYYWTSTDKVEKVGTSVPVTATMNDTTLYAKACNSANVCSENASYKINVDATAPHYVSGGILSGSGVSFPKYEDNAKGSGGVAVYVCIRQATQGVPTYSDSCFKNGSASYTASCGVTYTFYSYAMDIAGNRSPIISNHQTNTYYSACYTPAPTYSGGSYKSSSSSGTRKSSTTQSTCDATCKMQQNSLQWWEIEADNSKTSEQKKAEQAKLHEENKALAQTNPDCNGGCNFTSSGHWQASGSTSNLYEVNSDTKDKVLASRNTSSSSSSSSSSKSTSSSSSSNKSSSSSSSGKKSSSGSSTVSKVVSSISKAISGLFKR